MINSRMIQNELFIRLLLLDPTKFKKIIKELSKVYSEDTIVFLINRLNNI